MGKFNQDRIKRNGKGDQKAYGRERDEIRLYAVSERASEAISGSGLLVRVDGAAAKLRQTIYPAHEVELKPAGSIRAWSRFTTSIRRSSRRTTGLLPR